MIVQQGDLRGNRGATDATNGAALEAEADAAARGRDLARAAALLTRACGMPDAGVDRWIKLTAVRRAGGDLEGALAATAGALSLDPLAFLPLLHRAGLLQALGREGEAGEAAGAALFHAPPPERLPPPVRAELARIGEVEAAYRRERRGRLDGAAAGPAASLAPAAAARVRRFVGNAVRDTRAYAQQPSHFHYPGLPVVEFWDMAELPGLEPLAAAADAIRGEFLAVQASGAGVSEPYVRYDRDLPLAQWAALNNSDQWSAVHLWRAGKVVAENAGRCPAAMRAFGQLDFPRVPGRSPNLMFSVLAPGARIPPHTGVANTRLVVHLPLIVPPGCGFRVGAETRPWVEGVPFAFDDTIEHEAWNEGTLPRVVLIGDLWRPELEAGERDAVAAVMGAEGGADGMAAGAL